MAHAEAVDEHLAERQVKAVVEQVTATAVSMPTADQPESDGTAVWRATTMILVECRSAGVTGIGYTYAHAATARLIDDLLSPCVRGLPALSTAAATVRMGCAVRNQGHDGIAATAISAVDNALWDLKARLLGVPLALLLGGARSAVPLYASGGFTSSDLDALAHELSDYAARGFERVKLKVGRAPDIDVERVRVARAAIGPDVMLMVDANGAYDRKEALRMAERFGAYDVRWFEEPVSSDDLAGLRLLRDRAPAGMEIAAGEYGYDLPYFRRMLSAGAVDVLQADATRCAGITGFMQADALCTAHCVPLSSHCAPTLHAHLGAAASRFVHLEYFRDHARMEERLFEGAPQPVKGCLPIDPKRPGLGVTLRREEMRRHAA